MTVEGDPGWEGASTVRVRGMTSGDVPAVTRIEAATFSNPWSAQSFLRLIGSPEHVLVWVADDGEDTPPIGYAVFWHAADEGELANVAVARERRHQGIGSKLLECVLTTARQLGVRSVFLEVRESNVGARRLYEGHGFEAIGVRRAYYTRPVEDATIMRRMVEGTPT